MSSKYSIIRVFVIAVIAFIEPSLSNDKGISASARARTHTHIYSLMIYYEVETGSGAMTHIRSSLRTE